MAYGEWQPMRIERSDGQSLVLGPTPGYRAGMAVAVLGFLAFLAMSIYFQVVPISIMCGIGVLVFGGAFIGTRIVVSRPTGTVVIGKRPLLFFLSRREIPFASIGNVDIRHQALREPTGRGGSSLTKSDYWQVVLNTDGQAIHVVRSKDYHGMHNLAKTIGEFTGIPMPKRAEDMSRDEAVASWRQRHRRDTR